MRTLIGAGAALVVALACWIWLAGGEDRILRWAIEGQRAAQNGLAGALRQLRAGHPGAWVSLLTLCFAYGFFHAAGPGHGKLVIAGYGLGRRVPVLRLSGLALASSLAQAASAIALVYAGILILGLGRDRLVASAENWLAPASYLAIALIGAWLALRGARKLVRTGHHDHPHTGHDDTCATCGHRHGPTLEEAAAVNTVRDGAILIGAIALRPCTGALFVLILTYQMGIMAAGIAGALAMGLGTAAITIAVAIASSTMREGMLLRLNRVNAGPILAALELGAGLMIAALALRVAWTMI